MLACLQRRQNPPPQHPVCASKTLEPPQTLRRKCELTNRPQAIPSEKSFYLSMIFKVMATVNAKRDLQCELNDGEKGFPVVVSTSVPLVALWNFKQLNLLCT